MDNAKRKFSPAERRIMKTLKSRISELKSEMNMEQEFRGLNSEDHPVRSSPSKKQKRQSLLKEGELRAAKKNAESMISKIKAGRLGGGGGGSLNLAQRGDSRSQMRVGDFLKLQ